MPARGVQMVRGRGGRARSTHEGRQKRKKGRPHTAHAARIRGGKKRRPHTAHAARMRGGKTKRGGHTPRTQGRGPPGPHLVRPSSHTIALYSGCPVILLHTTVVSRCVARPTARTTIGPMRASASWGGTRAHGHTRVHGSMCGESRLAAEWEGRGMPRPPTALLLERARRSRRSGWVPSGTRRGRVLHPLPEQAPNRPRGGSTGAHHRQGEGVRTFRAFDRHCFTDILRCGGQCKEPVQGSMQGLTPQHRDDGLPAGTGRQASEQLLPQQLCDAFPEAPLTR